MHRCLVCGYLYNPEEGDPMHDIVPNTPFEDLPETWVCPVCSVTKEYFERI